MQGLPVMGGPFYVIRFEKEKAHMNEDIVMIVSAWEQTEKELGMVPHRRFMDLTLCYYMMHKTGEFGNHVNLMIMDFKEAERRGLNDEEELFRIAARNTMREFPLLIRDLGNGMFVMTNKKNVFGATSMFYPGSLVEVSEQIGGNMVIVPVSIHEIICLPAEEADVDDLQESLIHLNFEETPDDCVLSSSLYYYDAGCQRISALTVGEGVVQ